MPKRSSGYAWMTASVKKPREFSRVHDERYNSRRWRNLRANFIKQYPICQALNCKALATVCDHITPVVDGGDFWNGPFQSLCARHHNAKSSRERRKREQR